MNKINVLVVPVKGLVAPKEISPTLEAMQALVGGYIERVVINKLADRTIVLYVNEEGIATEEINPRISQSLGIPFLGQPLHGQAFIVAETGPEGDLDSLTVEEMLTLSIRLESGEPLLRDVRRYDN